MHLLLFPALICLSVLILPLAPAHAEEAPAKTEEKAEEKKTDVPEAPKEDTPLTQWMAAEKKISDDLTEEEKKVFYVIRNKFGIMRAVNVVRRDIGNAVEVCGAANPALKEPMDLRYSQWKGAVEPILNDADTFVQKEIDEQKSIKPAEFRKILKMNDEAFAYQESLIKKEPVSDEESCQKLLKSMDRSEDELLQLLKMALLPENVIRERAQQERKEIERKRPAAEKKKGT